MPSDLLRQNKDAVTTKLHLALFTASPEDNKTLAGRVAKLEIEYAGRALAHGQKETAYAGFVSAAVAHKMLGNDLSAIGYLRQAKALGVGDPESSALLSQAIDDLQKKILAAAPKPPKPVEKAPEPAPEPETEKASEPEVEEKPEPEPEPEKASEPEVEEKPEPVEKAEKPKKPAKKRRGRKKELP